MKFNKFMIVSMILLAIITLGAASAAEDVTADNPADSESDVVSVPASDAEIETGGDVVDLKSTSNNDVASDDNNASGDSETKLGATEDDVLSQPTTHVVTVDTFSNYFSSKGKLSNVVQPGDTLDFQGSFITSGSTKYVMVISKPIHMISSTKDAYIDLDTKAGSMTGESPGNSFEINYGGSGTTISDIYFHNSQIWFYGAHNITANNMSVVVEDQQIGSGVGTVALRGGSTNITFRNCYFYTKNNGGSSTLVLTNASYVTVDKSVIKVEGNVGNMVYLNAYNLESTNGMYLPEILAKIKTGELTLNDHFTMTNSKIIHPDAASSICIAVTCQVSSGYNVFENNEVDYEGSSVSLGQNAVVRNNIIRGSSLAVAAGSTVEGNEIYGSTMSVAGAGSTVTGNYIQNTATYAINIASSKSNTENVITNNYLSSASRTGDDAVNDAGKRNTVQDNQEYQEPVSNIVTQDNFFEFFDESGILREEVAFDELIFQGDFSDLTNYVILDRPIGIVGDGAVLNEMGIVVSASNVYLNDLTLKATSSLGDLIYIVGNNVNVTGLDIDYATGEEDGRAINVYGVENVTIRDTDVNYESHVTSDTNEAGAYNIEESNNVEISGGNIVTSLPALEVTNHDPSDSFMGVNTVNPIRIIKTKKVSISGNNITSNNNDYSQEYATIQAFLIKDSVDCIIDGNNISLIDEIAVKGQDIFLYGISFANDTNLVMSNNNFNVHTNGGKYALGTAYAVQGITSSLVFVKNNITTFSNGPNIGIYVTSTFGEDAYTVAEFNIINVTGYGSKGDDWALVTGIEIQNGNAYIYNNTIYTYNVGEYDDENNLYGVSYTQWMYGSRMLDIRDNTIVTEGKYTVYTKPDTELTVTGNVLYAHDLVGDASVNPNEGEGVLVEDNYPAICNNITVTVDDVFDNEPIVVVVNVPGATGTVTIKINNKEYVVDLIDGVATEEISDYGDDRLVNATFNGDLKYYSNWNTTTFKVILGNVVVNDTFFDYFDEDGNLKSIIPYEELIFKGEFSDLGVDVITLNRPIDIVGDEAILSDIGFKIISGDVKLANMSLIAEDVSFTSNNGAVIFINDVENVTLEKLDIDYYAPSDANAYAVYAKDAVDFNLLDSTIFFDANNVGVQVYQHGIEIRDCEDVIVKGNVIKGALPSQTADWEGEGINKDYPLLIGIQNGENIVLAENEISIITEPGSGSTATLDGIMADGFKDLTISKNNITHIDFTGDQKAGYVYTIDLYNFEGALIEYNNILVNTTTGVEAAGSAYPIQLTGPFNALVIDNNNLTSSSKGPNLGIFAANYYGGAAEALISNNFINVTGYATAENWALVSGIEFEGTYAGIYNNTIYVQSIAPYADDNSMYGISFAQYGSPGEFDIQNNTIFADGKYAVYLGTAKDSVITENTLYAHDLMGDDAAVALGDNNVVVNNYPGTPSINVKATNVFDGQPTIVTVTVPGATGNVTIRVNNKEYVVNLTEGVAVQEISDYGDDYFVNVTYNGDYKFFPVSNSTTFKLLDNVVVNDTFFDYFDEDGFLKSVVPYDELIFQGEFSNLPNVNINRELTITGQDAVLENIGFVISSEEVKLDGLTLNANGNLGDLIIVKESDVELCNLNISYVAGDKAANVINVKGSDTLYDVYILNNNIYFSSNVAKDSQVNTAINLEDVEDILVDGNNITVELPALTVNSYDWTYFLMGLAYVNPVRIYESYSVDFTNNNVNVSSNGYSGSFPTIQTLYIVGSNGVLIEGNNFTMRDELIPQGTPSFLYVVEAGFSNDIDFIDNNFDIYTTGGKSAAGAAYALQLVTTSSIVRGNNITSDSNGPNLGIYLPMGFGVAKDLLVEKNFINVTGYAASSSTDGLISAIEVQTGYAKIYNNTIFTQNKGDYNEKYPVYGISSAQSGVKTLSFDIKDNSINTNGVYAVEFNNEVNNANVTDNYLIATGFLGDKSVFIKKGNDNVVKDNYPAFTSEILIDIDTVWIGSDDEIVITVPDFAGKVNIKINGETFSADLNESVAKYTLPASALVAGENTVEVEFIPEEFTGVLASNSTTFRVLDGVITNETYPYYFGEDNYLVDIAPEGAVLDFQGLFAGDYVININKPVNIVSSTGDALFTTGAGNKANLNILAGADSTNVTGLSFVNYCVFVKGASYVTIDGINAVANQRGVGSGTGFVSIHSNAYYTTVKNCYLENGGTGSSVLVLGKGGKYATFDNNTCNITGSSGNVLSSNVFVGSGDNPEFVNYTNNRIISSVAGSSTMYGITVCGQGNIIENNTLTNFKGNAIVNQFGATSTKNVYRNNTITGGGSMAVGTYSLVESNTLESTLTVTEGCTASENNVYGLTISGKNVVARDNTVAGAVTINSAATNTTFTGNDVTGTVTVKSNNNVIKENRINSTGEYAVDLTTKTGNEVTDNWLYSSSLYGDAAVKFSGDNVVKDNLPNKVNLTVSVDNITVGEDAVINVKLDAAAVGAVIVNVNGQLLDVEINDGEGSVSVSGLFASDYTVTATFIPSSAEFGGDEASTVFNVAKVKNNLTIAVPECIDVGDSPVIDITLGNVNDTVTVLINGKEETVDIVNGKGNVTIENITAGDYSIVARYDGDKNNEPAFGSASFSIAKIKNDLIISVPDTIMAGDSPVIDIALGNVNGNLTVVVDGKEQTVDLIDGKANVTIENITAGSHSIVAIFDGDVNNEPSFASASFSADKTATNIVLEIEDGLMYGDSTVIKAHINATGDVVFFISGASESVPIVDGVASLEITGLPAGDFAVDAIYLESDLYLASNASGIMKVSKWNSTISASAEPIQVGENATVVVVLPSDATGKVTINDKFIGEVIDGVANVVVSGLTQNATLTVVYEGDEKYNGNETTVDVEVSKVSDYNMTVTGSSNDGKTIVDVELPEDANGNVTVTTPNGNTTVPVEDGKATVVIPDLPAGENTVEVTYSGDDKYNPQSTEQTVNTTKRDSILSGGKLEMTVGDGSKFTVTLTDSEGNPIANRGIKFIIVGKTYTVKTDKNGVASLPINLKAGSYPITAIFDGDSVYNPSNAVVTSVEVYTNSRISENKDLVKTEGGSEKFTVRALDKYGKPVGANAKVKMTIAGKTYTVNTDANGYASLPINLKAGTYQITTEYGGTKVTNKVTVKKK